MSQGHVNLILYQRTSCQDYGFEDRGHGFYLGFEKIVSNLGTTRAKACGNLVRVSHLNAVSSSVSTSLTIELTPDLLPKQTSLVTLLDCGSSDCFLDSRFVQKYSLKPYDITPIPLRLFDGTTNTSIIQAIDLPIRLPTCERQTVTFYVTRLDSSCSAVLGHNWLTRYNPTIDWVLGSITFKTSGNLKTAIRSNLGPTPDSPSDQPRLCSALASPRISLINAAAFMRACSLEGSTCFQMNTTTSELSGKATLLVPSPELLDKVKANIPEDYTTTWTFSIKLMRIHWLHTDLMILRSISRRELRLL